MHFWVLHLLPLSGQKGEETIFRVGQVIQLNAKLVFVHLTEKFQHIQHLVSAKTKHRLWESIERLAAWGRNHLLISDAWHIVAQLSNNQSGKEHYQVVKSCLQLTFINCLLLFFNYYYYYYVLWWVLLGACRQAENIKLIADSENYNIMASWSVCWLEEMLLEWRALFNFCFSSRNLLQ